MNSFINTFFKVGIKEVLLALPAPMAASTSAFKNARKIVSRISTAITDTEPFKVTSGTSMIKIPLLFKIIVFNKFLLLVREYWANKGHNQ